MRLCYVINKILIFTHLTLFDQIRKQNRVEWMGYFELWIKIYSYDVI
jgi:hypothetical protein